LNTLGSCRSLGHRARRDRKLAELDFQQTQAETAVPRETGDVTRRRQCQHNHTGIPRRDRIVIPMRTVPGTAAPIRSKVQDVERLSRIVQTYHDVDITTPFLLGGQHSVGNGVVLAIDMAGVVQALDAYERTEGDSSSPI
jgi:hypothetical protein